jgi:hypothetical protein
VNHFAPQCIGDQNEPLCSTAKILSSKTRIYKKFTSRRSNSPIAQKKNCPAAFPTPSADDKWQNAAQKNEFLADHEHIPSLEQQQAVLSR